MVNMRVLNLNTENVSELGVIKQNSKKELPKKTPQALNFAGNLIKANAINLNAIYLNSKQNKHNNRINVVSFCGSMTKESEMGIRTGQNVISLEGEWEYLPYNGPKLTREMQDSEEWPKMNIPGNWFLMGKKEFPKKFKIGNESLPDAGALTPMDPDKGFNYNGTMYYKKTIEHTPKAGKYTFLDLGMVDYYGQVFVNGQEVPNGYHEGYFQPWSVDITNALKKGENQIIIKVTDPEMPVDMSQTLPIAWPKMQNLVKGVLKYHDARPGGVTSRGQECGTGGIIEGIHLRTNDGFEISKLMITPQLTTTPDGKISKDTAFVNVKFRVENFTDKDKEILVEGRIKPHNFEKEGQDKDFDTTIIIPPGGKDFEQEIKIDKPELWWCRDIGKPNLYNLNIKLCDAKNPEKILDTRISNFGLRKIEKYLLDPNNKDIDNEHKKWGFRLNGENVYIRGSNYLSTQWMSMADKAFYERDVKLMEEGNLNAVRVHAKIDREEFYNQADEHGIMVWQDFPLQWGYTDSKEFHAEALKQAGDMTEELYNHPSIIYYCMHNEAPYSLSWMSQNKKLFPEGKQNLELDEKLVKKVKSIDSTRVVSQNSGSDDGHHYPGWNVPMYGMEKGLRRFSMISEYGVQSLSDKKLLEQMLPSEELKLSNPADLAKWAYGDFVPEKFALKYTDSTKKSAVNMDIINRITVSKGKNIDEFIKISQVYQAAMVKSWTEKQRQIQGKPSTGVFEFQFTDNWPAIATWSKLDGNRNKKKSFFALQEAMQPLLPGIRYNIAKPYDPIGLTIVNDFHKDLANHTIHWQIGDNQPNSQLIETIKSDGVIDLPDIGKLPNVTKGKDELKVWITDENGKKIAQNHLCKEHFIPKNPFFGLFQKY
ncbi:MAG: glycoside hydrolase family 2 TIM barrel-domain containing protein [Candidatus Gastranaerophilaceae bacterium]|jgi:beta-mannosidase